MNSEQDALKQAHELIKQYEEKLKKKDELANATKENNAAMEELRKEYVTLTTENEIDGLIYKGYKYAPSIKPAFRFKNKADLGAELSEMGEKSEFDVLRKNGFGDLVKETVNAQSLNSRLNEIVDIEYSKEDCDLDPLDPTEALPEDIARIVAYYDKPSISRRKATKKQLEMEQAKIAVQRMAGS